MGPNLFAPELVSDSQKEIGLHVGLTGERSLIYRSCLSWALSLVMGTAQLPPDALTEALTEALSETPHEHHDLFREVFGEVLEDFALVEAIQEGEDTETVDRDQIMEMLGGST